MRTGTVSWLREDEDDEVGVVVRLVVVPVRSRSGRELRGTIGWVVAVVSVVGTLRARRAVVVVGGRVVVVTGLAVVAVLCGAPVTPDRSGRVGRGGGGGGDGDGGGGGGAGGSSKSFGGTLASASLMKAFQV